MKRSVEGATARWRPRGRVIALIWVGVMCAAFVLAVIFQDGDRSTDEGAGFGALAGLVGGVVTAIYIAVGVALDSMKGRRRLARFGVAVGIAIAIAGTAAVVIAGSAWSSEESDTSSSGDESPANGLSNVDPVAAVTAAAAKSASTSITSVDCPPALETGEVSILTCVVTYEGPSCQLWLVPDTDDPEPTALGDPAPGRRGSVAEGTGRASCS